MKKSITFLIIAAVALALSIGLLIYVLTLKIEPPETEEPLQNNNSQPAGGNDASAGSAPDENLSEESRKIAFEDTVLQETYADADAFVQDAADSTAALGKAMLEYMLPNGIGYREADAWGQIVEQHFTNLSELSVKCDLLQPEWTEAVREIYLELPEYARNREKGEIAQSVRRQGGLAVEARVAEQLIYGELTMEQYPIVQKLLTQPPHVLYSQPSVQEIMAEYERCLMIYFAVEEQMEQVLSEPAISKRLDRNIRNSFKSLGVSYEERRAELLEYYYKSLGKELCGYEYIRMRDDVADGMREYFCLNLEPPLHDRYQDRELRYDGNLLMIGAYQDAHLYYDQDPIKHTSKSLLLTYWWDIEDTLHLRDEESDCHLVFRADGDALVYNKKASSPEEEMSFLPDGARFVIKPIGAPH